MELTTAAVDSLLADLVIAQDFVVKSKWNDNTYRVVIAEDGPEAVEICLTGGAWREKPNAIIGYVRYFPTIEKATAFYADVSNFKTVRPA